MKIKNNPDHPIRFEGNDYNGKPVTSSDYLGKKHIVLILNRTLM